ncbi:MAG: hypothetical protein KDK78_11290 [Chlamydiia bacterium]|nr:hypothetical protein [Chlamydiia bacterium]
MNLPPHFFTDFGMNEAAGEAVAEEGTAETKDSEESKETTRSEDASTVTNASGDVIIAGVGGNSADGGGAGGGGHNPEHPELAEIDASSVMNMSLENLTSAMVHAIYALVMSETAQSRADYTAGESWLNEVYRNVDNIIDTTTSEIMRNQLKKAHDARIEAEEKASQMSGLMAGLMAVFIVVAIVVVFPLMCATIYLAPLAIALTASATVVGPCCIALEASGGSNPDGGIYATLCDMVGLDDALGRAFATSCLMFFVIGPVCLVYFFCALQMNIEVDKANATAKEALNIRIVRDTAQKGPIAMKQALEEAGATESMAEIMAFIAALLLMLLMMMGLQGGSIMGGAAQGGGGADAAAGSVEGGGEGGEGGESVEGGGEGGMSDFGSFGEGEGMGMGGNFSLPTTAQIQSAAVDSKNVAAQIDVSQILADLKEILAGEEFNYPSEALNNETLNTFINDHGQELAEIAMSIYSAVSGQIQPTIDYASQLLQPSDGATSGFSVSGSSMS